MHLAKAAGYEITFIGVSLAHPDLNVARVALRVSEGGHDVPVDRIIARYERTMMLMPQAIMIADRSLVFDNSDSAAGPLLVLTADRVGKSLGSSQLIVRMSRSLENDLSSWVHQYLLAGLESVHQDQASKLAYGAALVP